MDPYTSPQLERSALLTIDVQRDFTLPGPSAEIAGSMGAVEAMGRVVEAFRRVRRPIVHVVRLYSSDGSNVDLCRRWGVERGDRLVIVGSEGAELVDELKAGGLQPLGEREWIMYKPHWGAFYGTPLEDYLRKLGVDSVVVCGCNSPNCPRTTVYEASERDLRVVLVEDATSGTYQQARRELNGIGVTVMTVDECVSWCNARMLPAP